MKQIRPLLTVVLAGIFLFSTGKYLLQLGDNAAAAQSYSQALQLAAPSAPIQSRNETTAAPEESARETVYVPLAVTGDPHTETLNRLDLAALQAVNPEVIGWILLPGTAIDYPIVQGPDNAYYLEHTWNRERNPSGAIFLETLNHADMTEFHSILYGHNMVNNTMFAPLRSYKAQQQWDDQPYVYLRTQTGVFRYEIYAAYEASTEDYTYSVGMQQDDTKAYFLQFTAERSVIDTGITPAITDRILTLSTCNGMGYQTRWVVHARLPMVQTTA